MSSRNLKAYQKFLSAFFQNTGNTMKNSKRMSAGLANVFGSFNYPFHSLIRKVENHFGPMNAVLWHWKDFFFKRLLETLISGSNLQEKCIFQPWLEGKLRLGAIGAGHIASCCNYVSFCILSSGSHSSREAWYRFLLILTCFVVFCSTGIIKKEVFQIQKNITHIFNDLSITVSHFIHS